MAKDVFTLNELSETSRVLNDLNDWLLDHEDYDDFTVLAALVTIVDGKGDLIGTFTKWTKDDEVKFEPDFKPDMVDL